MTFDREIFFPVTWGGGGTCPICPSPISYAYAGAQVQTKH